MTRFLRILDSALAVAVLAFLAVIVLLGGIDPMGW